MIELTITCDYCGKIINHKTEEYLSIDGYWKIKDTLLDDMNLHEECWNNLKSDLEKNRCKSPK